MCVLQNVYPFIVVPIVCVSACVYLCVCMYVCIYVCVYVCMYVCMYMCVCMYVYVSRPLFFFSSDFFRPISTFAFYSVKDCVCVRVCELSFAKVCASVILCLTVGFDTFLL